MHAAALTVTMDDDHKRPPTEEGATGTSAASPPDAQATIAALKAELAAVRAERDALRDELRERNETKARFLALLEKRRRQAREREQEPGSRLH